MKKIILAFGFMACTVLVQAQATEISGKYDKIGKFNKGLAVVHKGEMVGIINTEGKEIVKPEYDKITPFGNDDLAYTYKKGLVGLVNREGTILVDNIYDYIGHFKSGNAIVRKNDLCGVINRQGKLIVDVKYQRLNTEAGVIKAINADGTQVLLKPNE